MVDSVCHSSHLYQSCCMATSESKVSPQRVWTQAGSCGVQTAETSVLGGHVTTTSLKEPLATSPSNPKDRLQEAERRNTQ